jgi:hypothetical protein
MLISKKNRREVYKYLFKGEAGGEKGRGARGKRRAARPARTTTTPHPQRAS